MLSASEAKSKTQNNIDDCVTQELKMLDEKISQAIAEGEFHISCDGSLQLETRNKLERLGYKIETGSQYNVPWYNISWN